MSFGRSRFASVSRATATVSGIALLMSAGLFTPANAAEGVAFQPTVNVFADQSTQFGEDLNVRVSLDALAGTEWTDEGTKKAPLSVRVDVYGEYAPGAVPAASPTVPAGAVKVASQVFVADNGAGDYIFDVDAFDYNSGTYSVVASVLKADGSNDPIVTADVSSQFAGVSGLTVASYAPEVTAVLDRDSAGDIIGALDATGFNGTTLEVTSTLYGPFLTAPVPAASAPSDATIADTTVNLYAGGAAAISSTTPTGLGYYVLSHSIVDVNGVELFNSGFANSPNDVINVTSLAPIGNQPVINPPVVNPPVVTPPVVTDPVVTDPTVNDGGAGAGGGANINLNTGYADCTAARAAGDVNIPSDSPSYASKLDSDKDGIACESNGQDSAVAIDGGFAQASATDNTPFIAGGVALVLLAMGLGATAVMRRKNAVK